MGHDWQRRWTRWLPKPDQSRSLVVDLVRHGHPQSVVGVQEDGRGFFQGPDDPLTVFGQYQAGRLAIYLKRMDFHYTMALIGPHLRQRQTWQIIQGVLPGLPFKVTELLAERHVPSVLWGRPWDDPDPEVRFANSRRIESFYANGKPYPGDENFSMLRKRSLAALTEIDQYSPGRVLVLSSSALMKMLVSVAIYGSSLTAQRYRQLDAFLRFDYASFSTYQRSLDQQGTGQWQRILENYTGFLWPSWPGVSPS